MEHKYINMIIGRLEENSQEKNHKMPVKGSQNLVSLSQE
jgi:hypothetical protein